MCTVCTMSNNRGATPNPIINQWVNALNGWHKRLVPKGSALGTETNGLEIPNRNPPV